MYGALLGATSGILTVSFFQLLAEPTTMLMSTMNRCSADLFFWGGLSVAFTSAVLVYGLRQNYFRRMSVPKGPIDAPPHTLIVRLQAYAELNGLPNPDVPLDGADLSTAQHQILLGILKKVEAKSTAIATVASIFFAVVSAIFASAMNKVSAISFFIFIAVSVSGWLLLGFLIAGAAHVSNFQTAACDTAFIARKKLQRALAHDLLVKEAHLEASVRLFTLCLILVFVAAVVEAFRNYW